MRKSLALIAVVLLAWGSMAEARPVVVIGPGLNTGRTQYHQNWNRTLSADTLYTLTGHYQVDSTFSLTIQPGTVVQGDTAAALVVKRGARIYANGEKCNPIIFTSRKPAGSRNRGDWGGILILGAAPVNKVEPLIEGGIFQGSYGGNLPADNSGVFKYVRIEFCGYRYQLNNEINGLTMGGVGSGTEIHHVQVSYSFDDSFEWFGGTVNPHHLVAFGGTDDEFDTDFGFSGKAQFCFALRDLNYWDPTGESNGFESDNDASATSTDTPYTSAVFSNVTMVGPERTDALVGNLPVGNKFQYSAVLRRSTKFSFFNSVICGYPWGISLRDATTQNWANTNELQVRDVSIAASQLPSGSATVHDQARWASVATWFGTAGWNNLGSAVRNPSAVGLTSMSNLNDPNPVPAPGSELIGSADFTWPKLAGFQAVTYRGAFDPTKPMSEQWTACWTNFDPQSSWNPATDVAQDTHAPRVAVLDQNHPNPFNPMTAIRFAVPTRGHVTLKVYDAKGQVVANVVDQEMPAGAYERSFDASGLASGTYFYRLAGPGFEQTRKMSLMK
jgi:hypothetical protein